MAMPRAIIHLDRGLSISRGTPLEEESGIGALTPGGYVREIAANMARTKLP